MLVRPESNSRPPVWQCDAQLSEPPVRGHKAPLNLGDGDLLAPKNHTMSESVRVEIEIGIQRISNWSENEKTFTILICNEPDKFQN